MAELPTGTVTLLFTDIEGSTRLLQRLGGGRYADVLRDHHRVLRAAISSCSGVAVKTEGDSFFAVFPRAADAVTAAIQVQRALAASDRPDHEAITVRMGIHTGDVALVEGEYVSLDVHRAARISAAAHGGQVLLSKATEALLADNVPAGVRLVDLGEHGLKDLERAERLFQLSIDGLRAEFPPLRAVTTRLDKLPPETTAFIGRERELARARELLAGTRLLTLTGPGGTGKTRLALRLARELSTEFTDGAAFVPLAAISDPDLVATVIRQTLGFGEEPGRTPIETLSEQLHDRHALVVLDNFEQLLPAASTVATLVQATDRLKLVVTSRSVLHLTGEQEFAVPPLDVPVAAETTDLATLGRTEAVALFMHRARTVRPDFELTEANAGAIVEICARVDGLPLAIELAASRVKLLPPQALLARLEKRLDLLQSTSADRTDRQRTLRGAIDWSYGLLGEAERALFRRLAIFVGGWTLDHAERVVPAAGELPLDVLDGLSALVDHSLVRQVGDGDEPRFGMLETIREYGREQLAAAAELALAANAHAGRFAALVAEAEPHLTAEPSWLARLDRDHANVRAALAQLAEGDLQAALSMAGSLWRFWHLRGYLRDGAHILRELLDRPSAAPRTAARAKALVGLAGLVYWQSDYSAARAAYEEALAIARENADRRLEVEILYSLGYVRGIEHDYDAAVSAYSQAKEIYEELGAELGVAWAMIGIGMTTTLRGDHEASLPLIRESQRRFEALGDQFGLRNTLGVAARPLMQLGRLAESREVNRRHIELSHAGQDPTALSAAILDTAALEALSGRHDRAARLVGAGQRIVEESGGQAPPELVNRVDPLPILRQALPAEALARLIGEGRRMSDEEAVTYALEEPGPG